MDIAITWDVRAARGDWSIASGDLALDNPLRSAIMVSLFSDGLAPQQPTSLDAGAGISGPSGAVGSPEADRRGWWGDTYEQSPIGSRLWQLKRAIKVGDRAIPLELEAICRDALQWLIDDGVAEDVSIDAWWSKTNTSAVEFSVTVKRPAVSSAETFLYSWAWEGLV